jgi:hypothetical protein
MSPPVLLAIRYSLFAIRYSLFAIRYSLPRKIRFGDDALEGFGIAADAIEQGAVAFIRKECDDLASACGTLHRMPAAVHAELVADVVAVRRGRGGPPRRPRERGGLGRETLLEILGNSGRRLLTPATAPDGSDGDRLERGQGQVLGSVPVAAAPLGSNARALPRCPPLPPNPARGQTIRPGGPFGGRDPGIANVGSAAAKREKAKESSGVRRCAAADTLRHHRAPRSRPRCSGSRLLR